MVAIRKNSLKRIREILSKSAVISCYKYDDMTSSTNSRVTVDDVMAAGEHFEFSRVSLDDAGNLSVTIHQNWFYTAYATAESARNRLTPEAFAKYFPSAT